MDGAGVPVGSGDIVGIAVGLADTVGVVLLKVLTKYRCC